ncbi:MAG: FAD-dependent oxidoreductase [Actinomycetota bacterium]
MGSAAIVGAGPYGLSLAAYLLQAGVETHVFGEPMESWRQYMPEGMRLRSHQVASHIAHPGGDLGIETWAAETNATPSEPLHLSEFVSYGHWFQERAVPDVDRRRVRKVDLAGSGFSLRLDDGEELEFERVVMATGIAPFALRPPLFEGLPAELVSHCSAHATLEGFADRSVLVIGGGQSAVETAALLKEAGAKPHLVARAGKLTWLPPHNQTGFRARAARILLPPTDVGGLKTGWFAAAPGVFRFLPAKTRAWVYGRCTAPLGADWLRGRLAEVPVEAGRSVTAVDPDRNSVRVKFDDLTERSFEHVILGTGYRIDMSRHELLADGMLDRLETVGGSARELGSAPRLRRGLESSIPGLHFAGASAAASFGPIMRFVVGTWFAAPAISRSISGRRQGPMYLSYRPRSPFRRVPKGAAPRVRGIGAPGGELGTQARLFRRER